MLPPDFVYDLNVVKDIAITNSFKTLDEVTKDCHDADETQDDCITRDFIDQLNGTCSCFPFNLRFSNEVSIRIFWKSS